MAFNNNLTQRPSARYLARDNINNGLCAHTDEPLSHCSVCGEVSNRSLAIWSAFGVLESDLKHEVVVSGLPAQLTNHALRRRLFNQTRIYFIYVYAYSDAIT